MPAPKRVARRWLTCCIFVAGMLPVLAVAESGPPAWFRQHLQQLTAGSGRWIADNQAYRGDDEPFDAYGLQWQPGLGGHTATGQLFGLRAGEQSEDFWQFRVYWDATGGHGVIEQFAGHGAVGRGPLTGFGEATLTDQTFTMPDGRQWRELHHAWFEDDARTGTADGVHVTHSFEWKQGAWTPKRQYRWQLQAADAAP